MYLMGSLSDISTDLPVDTSVVTRSTLDRYSTDTRPTSNECHNRYSIDIAADIVGGTLDYEY